MESFGNENNEQKTNCSVMLLSKAPTVARRQYHSAAQTSLDDIPKEHIFGKVYSLINRLTHNPLILLRILTQLQFFTPNQQKQNFIVQKNVQKQQQKSGQKLKIPRVSINCSQEIKLQCLTKNISSKEFFSAQTILSLNSLNLPNCPLSLAVVESIYEIPLPFLIALSVCLLLKYVGRSGVALTSSSACWIMSISTIIAYKLYYDEPVGGLVDSFAYILDVPRETIIDLERCMLQGVDYETTITNSQYHQVLCLLIAEDKS